MSKLKPACLIYSYSFVCSATMRVPSFVEACLCYAHGCTFLALLSMPSPNPLAWHWIEACNHQEKQESVACRDNDVWRLDGEGSRSSHLFFIIKATCNSLACFGWDSQACIQAIGTRDVCCKRVSKYASDQERSSLSASTKTRAQQVTCSFHILVSGSCTWIRDAWVFD